MAIKRKKGVRKIIYKRTFLCCPLSLTKLSFCCIIIIVRGGLYGYKYAVKQNNR